MAIEVAPGVWNITAQAPGFWSAPTRTEIGETEGRHRIELWRTGDLIARVATENEAPIPDAIRVHFQPAATADDPDPSGPRGVAECRVEEAACSCSVPAGTLDLRLSAGDFVSHYFWNVEIPTGGTRSLGELRFQRGASVIGWVTAEGGRDAVEGTGLRLLPRGVLPQSSTVAGARIERTSLEAIANERGFFQIAGVPPGEYVLEATKEPWAPARVTVRVLVDRVTEVDNPPILLREPQTVDVYVEPPVPPMGGVWSIELVEVDRGSSTIASRTRATVPETGRWQVSDLAPAHYRLILGVGEDERWYSREIETGEDQPTIFVDVPVVEVRGEVSFGDEPLAAELWFGGKDHEVTVPLRSDSDGSFQGHLPRAGTWDLDVRGKEQDVHRSFQKVEVAKRKGKPYAELEVHVPDTVLRGVVVDEESVLASGATVTAQSLDEVVSAVRIRTDEAGEFEILGLPPGRATVLAEDGREDRLLYSHSVAVDLEDGGTPARVRLVLRPERLLRGRVIAGDRGVPGASVKADPTGVPGLPQFPAISDARGEFEVGVPAHARDLSLGVGAPGFSFRLLRVPLGDGEPVVVPVSEAGGTLVIELPDEVDPTLWGAPKVMLYHGGAVESLGYLLSWASFNGQPQQQERRFLIPRMEPGDYVACLMQADERFDRLDGKPSDHPCVSGYLPASGHLELSF